MSKLYFCVGCRQVHYDNDYCALDGDLLITDWDKFIESVHKFKKLVENYKVEDSGGEE